MIESAEEFVQLRSSADPAEYARAAHEEASLQVWLQVIERYPEMRPRVAQNKRVPVEILELLSRDEDERVRWFVASKRRLPERIQLRLAFIESESVQRRLVVNAKATEAVLEALSRDRDPYIREKARERLEGGTSV